MANAAYEFAVTGATFAAATKRYSDTIHAISSRKRN
jgi:hypothetical protein